MSAEPGGDRVDRRVPPALFSRDPGRARLAISSLGIGRIRWGS